MLKGRRYAAWAVSKLVPVTGPEHLPLPLASAAVKAICQMLKVRLFSSRCKMMSSIVPLAVRHIQDKDLQGDPAEDNRLQAAAALESLAWKADLRGLIAHAALPMLLGQSADSNNTALMCSALKIIRQLVGDDSFCGLIADVALQELVVWLKVRQLL